ncbi:MAG: Uma2 family endonuclease [Chloroflexota bacterium]
MAIFDTIIQVNTSGNIIGMGISEDVYMQDYAADFCEWLDGTVIKMSPVHDRHDKITRYLAILFATYFEYRDIGEIRQEPFVMRYQFDDNGEKKRRNREPDMQLILGDNQQNLTSTYMDGVADIVIEVVSPESQQRDYAEKFHEYEKAGVPEYWIIDPIKKEARFYHLNAKSAYVLQDVETTYSTDKLPNLIIAVDVFWQQKLPGPTIIVESVAEMFSN